MLYESTILRTQEKDLCGGEEILEQTAVATHFPDHEQLSSSSVCLFFLHFLIELCLVGIPEMPL